MEITPISILVSRSEAHPVLYDMDGNKLVDEIAIQQEVVQFYKGHFGTAAVTYLTVDIQIMQGLPLLSLDPQNSFIQPVLPGDVLAALNSIADTKAPGVDGFLLGSIKYLAYSWS